MYYPMRSVAVAVAVAVGGTTSTPSAHNPGGQGAHTATGTQAVCFLPRQEPGPPSSREPGFSNSILALHLLQHFRTRPQASPRPTVVLHGSLPGIRTV